MERKARYLYALFWVSLLSFSSMLVLPDMGEAAGRGTVHPAALISSPENNSVFEMGVEVAFSSYGSYDPDGNITEIYWWIRDVDGTLQKTYVGILNCSYVFKYEGRFIVELQLVDNDGLKGTARVYLTISGGELGPTAVIKSPADGDVFYVSEKMAYSANGSFHMPGVSLSYLWTFGDGASDTVEIGSHAYAAAGKYLVRLNVTDSEGLSDEVTRTIFVVDNSSSLTVFLLGAEDGGEFFVDQRINFSARCFIGKNETNLTFHWSYSNMNMPFEMEGSTFQCSFEYPGSVHVTVSVRDDTYGRATDSVSLTIRPLEYSDRYPSVGIYSPGNNNTYEAGSLIHFAGGGRDRDGEVVKRLWRFERDGEFLSEENRSWANFTQRFNETGNYTIGLTVVDNEGLSNSTWVGIRIVPKGAKPENMILHPYVSVPDSQRYVVTDGSNISSWTDMAFKLIAGGINASVGPTYCWDLGNGWVWSGTSIEPRYDTAGNYTLTLIAFAGDLYGSATAMLNIAPHSELEAKIVPLPDQAYVTYGNGTIVVRTGIKIGFECQYGKGPVPATYYWSFDHKGIDARDQRVNYTFSAARENFTIECRMEDGSGEWINHALLYVNVIKKTDPSQPVPGDTPGTPGSNSALPLPPWTGSGYLPAGVAAAAIGGAALFFAGTELGLGLLFPIIIFLYSKVGREKVLDNFTRGEIRGYIVANPGDHYTSIKQALHLKNGTLAFHLKKLEKEGMVKSQVDGIYRRYYPADMKVPEPDGGSLTEVQKIVLAKVSETPGISQKDIAGLLNVSTSTIAYHIESLIKKGRVRQEKSGIRVRYFPTGLEAHDGEKELRNDAG